MDLSKYQVVVIDEAMSNWDHPFVSEMMGKSIELKYRSYKEVYGDNVAPYDAADFTGTHIICCEKTSKGLQPFFCYKKITLDRCKQYQFDFPGLALVKKDLNENAGTLMNEFVSNSPHKDSEVGYIWSLAMDPKIRENRTKEEARIYRELMLMILASDFIGMKRLFCCGVLKIKSDHLWSKLGFQALHKSYCFEQSSINQSKVQMMILTQMSEYAINLSKQFKTVWDKRIIIEAKEKLVDHHNIKIAS